MSDSVFKLLFYDFEEPYDLYIGDFLYTACWVTDITHNYTETEGITIRQVVPADCERPYVEQQTKKENL